MIDYLPKLPSAAEWFGVAVLLLGVAALVSIVRGSKCRNQARTVRLCGLSSLAVITFGVWIGTAAQIEIVGPVILTCGCALSLCSVLLSIGLTWRRHLRPAILPLALSIGAVVVGWYAPRAMAAAMLLLLIWARRRWNQALLTVDYELGRLLSRFLLVTHDDAGAYLVQAWFGRFVDSATTLTLLVLAKRIRETATILPRSRSLAPVTHPLHLLSRQVDQVLDERLKTDHAAGRWSSWIRALTVELARRLFQMTGVKPAGRFLASLLLAEPPPSGHPSVQAAKDCRPPDPHAYVADLLRDERSTDLERMADMVTRDADQAGPEWLLSVAARAEQLREQLPRAARDHKIELVSEVLWAVHEGALGPRPEKYDVFDQLRLQVPHLVDGLAVQEIRVTGAGVLSVGLRGLPACFDELTLSRNGAGGRRSLLLETRDQRRWTFQKLDATAGEDIQLVFHRSE